MSESPINELLERAFGSAVEGDESSLADFYRSILAGPLYVPERFQSEKLSDAPQYPTPFLNILGVQNKDRVFIPAFSNSLLVSEWAGNPIKFRRCTGKELIELAPEGWWIAVNPGSDVSKEISPWEIQTLQGGDEGIKEIIEEMQSDDSRYGKTVRPPLEEEFVSLKNSLKNYGASAPAVSAVYLLIEDDAEDPDGIKLLIGARVEGHKSVGEDHKSALKLLAQKDQIGGHPIRVFVESLDDSGTTFGIFMGSEPVFTRTPSRSLFNKLMNALKR